MAKRGRKSRNTVASNNIKAQSKPNRPINPAPTATPEADRERYAATAKRVEKTFIDDFMPREAREYPPLRGDDSLLPVAMEPEHTALAVMELDPLYEAIAEMRARIKEAEHNMRRSQQARNVLEKEMDTATNLAEEAENELSAAAKRAAYLKHEAEQLCSEGIVLHQQLSEEEHYWQSKLKEEQMMLRDTEQKLRIAEEESQRISYAKEVAARMNEREMWRLGSSKQGLWLQRRKVQGNSLSMTRDQSGNWHMPKMVSSPGATYAQTMLEREQRLHDTYDDKTDELLNILSESAHALAERQSSQLEEDFLEQLAAKEAARHLAEQSRSFAKADTVSDVEMEEAVLAEIIEQTEATAQTEQAEAMEQTAPMPQAQDMPPAEAAPTAKQDQDEAMPRPAAEHILNADILKVLHGIESAYSNAAAPVGAGASAVNKEILQALRFFENIPQQQTPVADTLVNIAPIMEQQPVVEPLAEMQPVAAPIMEQQPVVEPLPEMQPVAAPIMEQQPVVEPLPEMQPIAAPIMEQQPVVEPLTEMQPVAAPIVEQQPVVEPLTEMQPVAAPIMEQQPVIEPLPEMQPVAAPIMEQQPVVEPLAEMQPVAMPFVEPPVAIPFMEPPVAMPFAEPPVTTPFTVDQVVAAPFATDHIVAMPFAGQSVDLPIVEQHPVDMPIVEQQPMAAPIVEQLPVDMPIAEQQPMAVPIVEQLPVDMPIEEQQPMATPIVEQLPVVDMPIAEQQPMAAPIVEQLPVDMPIVEQQPMAVPIVEQLPVDMPIAEQQPMATPIAEQQPIATPIMEPIPVPQQPEAQAFTPQAEEEALLAAQKLPEDADPLQFLAMRAATIASAGAVDAAATPENITAAPPMTQVMAQAPPVNPEEDTATVVTIKDEDIQRLTQQADILARQHLTQQQPEVTAPEQPDGRAKVVQKVAEESDRQEHLLKEQQTAEMAIAAAMAAARKAAQSAMAISEQVNQQMPALNTRGLAEEDRPYSVERIIADALSKAAVAEQYRR